MRRGKSGIDTENVQNKLKNLLRSPMVELATLLSDYLLTVQYGSSEDDLRKTVKYINMILTRLPDLYDSRFYFDSYLIKSISESWSRGSLRISNMIVPAYRQNWGHETIPIPIMDQPTKYHILDLIYIPCDEREDIPSLLDYPWLIHEMGHHLLSKQGKELIDRFTSYYKKVLSSLRLRSIADRGIAKTRANAVIDEVAEYWCPSTNSKSWVQEIAIDAISIWSCGPAYLSAFQFEHSETPDPFLIEQAHPPVELRTVALIQAARKLEWVQFISSLENMQRQWQFQLPPENRNRYIAFKNVEMYKGLIDATMNYCEQTGLPRFYKADFERIQEQMNGNRIPKEYIDLIVSAWIINKNQTENVYSEWEKKTYTALATYAIQ